MTGDETGGGVTPPSPAPLIDEDPVLAARLEAAWKAHLETCAAIEHAFRKALALPAEVDLTAFGERYAAAAGSERPMPAWPKKRPSEHELKREVLAIEQKARAALDDPDGLAIGNLLAALRGTKPEIFRALPEAVFVQLEARSGAPSSAAIRKLATAAAEVADLVPPAPKTHAGSGRPLNATAISIAVMLARDFETLMDRPASFDGSKDGGGRFAELVANVFDAARIGARPQSTARSAVRRLKEMRAPKSGLPK